ncbi:hypothetical protein B0H34DRAFT_672134 [Crassisporium funariophilum]|nr:hypothetical protein B0H34DRAFT_672134 [Crassisporium funariophilum]
MHLDLKAAFTAKQVARKTNKKVETKQEAQKIAKVQEQEEKIRQDLVEKKFKLPLVLYKLKDNVRSISCALGLAESAKSTVSNCSAAICVYIEKKERLRQDAWFLGL